MVIVPLGDESASLTFLSTNDVINIFNMASGSFASFFFMAVELF